MKTSQIKTSQLALREQLAIKQVQLENIVQQRTVINLSIHKLSWEFATEAATMQHKINKVQFSRPGGNPANQWPHCPMTSRVRAFYQIKESKERELRKNRDLLQQTFDHSKAILTSQRLVLENAQSDIKSQIWIINIQLH